MARTPSFKTVEAIGRTLADVEVTTTWGQPALKVGGRMFADHYVSYPCVLVRLSRVGAGALRDLVTGAHRFVSARTRKPAGGGHHGAGRQSRVG